MMIPDYPVLFWVTAIIAVILIGFAKAGFGGGVGVIATPLVALTIPVPEAAAILLPLLIIADMFTIRHYYGAFDRTSLKLLLPGALLGILLGAFFFGYFSDNERILKMVIGLIAVFFVLLQTSRAIIFGVLEKFRPPAPVGVLMGMMGGFTSSLVHAGGPAVSIYLLPQKLPHNIFVGTNVILFTIINLVKLIPYGYLGLLRVGNLTTIAILAPLTYVGVRLGIYLIGRFNETWFNWFIYSLLFLTGIQLILGRSVIDLLLK